MNKLFFKNKLLCSSLKKSYLLKVFKYNFHNVINSKSALKLNKDDTIYIDIRSKEDYENCHIKNSVNIHEFFTFLSMTDKEGIAKLKETFNDIIKSKGIKANKNLVFYENYLGALKGASCRAYFFMKTLGYDENKLYILEDGIEGWKHNNQEIEKGNEKDAEHNTNNSNNDNKSLFVANIPEQNDLYKLEDMKELINNYDFKQTHIIDVRDEEEWKGDSSSPYGVNYAPRKGRLPNAKFLLWTKLMNNDSKSFKSNEEIEQLVKDIGINDKNENIVVYCFKGARSSNSYVALKKAGYKNVKNYIGSWNEWSRYPELPIDDKKI